ncbi:MAG: HEAT repeat domain-containing protein [Candidatus Micrarchaeota archaeon]
MVRKHLKIAHISQARRAKTGELLVEPPFTVDAMGAFRVPEPARAGLTALELRTELDQGDPFRRVLKKANFAIEKAGEYFLEDKPRADAIRRIVEVIMDHGEPEGVPLLKKALELHGASEAVRAAVSGAVARIGGPDDFPIIVSSLRMSPDDPGPHLSALVLFADRHPDSRPAVLEALSGLHTI